MKNLVAVFICTKTIWYNLTKFEEGEMVWMTDDNLMEGRFSYPCFHPTSRRYPVFGEAAEALMPHLRLIPMPEHPIEYYRDMNELKRLQNNFETLRLIEEEEKLSYD